jgi:hypothetical protein
LPFGRGRRFGAGWNPALAGILGGWQLNSIVSVQSGTPLVITNTPNTARALGGGQRPNSNGFSAAKSGPIQDRLDSYMDAAAFSAPEPFTFGNVGRTLPDARGPRNSNVDISVAKAFRLREAIELQFRGEFFNAFNTPIFQLPNQAFGNRQFGTIAGQANDPRQVQLALRLVF